MGAFCGLIDCFSEDCEAAGEGRHWEGVEEASKVDLRGGGGGKGKEDRRYKGKKCDGKNKRKGEVNRNEEKRHEGQKG